MQLHFCKSCDNKKATRLGVAFYGKFKAALLRAGTFN